MNSIQAMRNRQSNRLLVDSSTPFFISLFQRRLVWAAVALAVAFPISAQEVKPETQPAAAEEAKTPTATTTRDEVLPEIRVLSTAEEELKQAPGVSTITAEDIEKRPPANDLSEIIRTMPGVNLTGNSSSGAYGNNRQIDLRGMGPENTLILIDGKPVTSRNSVRMGRYGERNTRGDSNWVPAEAVERIEVLRGPAAARYGSGAAGGVVNIITKRPSDHLSGTVSLYGLLPEDGDESDTKRTSFHLTGPIGEKFSFRLYGNLNKTTGDKPAVNEEASDVDVTGETIPPAGREGVRNRDIDALLRWDIAQGHILELEGGFSRQGNIYAGDRLMGTGNEAMAQLAEQGEETNTMFRRTGSLTHRGDYGEGRTSRVMFSYEETVNSRMNEGLAGGAEGTISAVDAVRSKSTFNNWVLNGEYNTPLTIAGVRQVLTVGAEYTEQELEDPYSVSMGTQFTGDTGGEARAKTKAVFIEDNIEVTRSLILTPGLRFDHHDQFGSNFSPSLNASYELTNAWTIKGGIARAFKAPNLYQSNPNYMYTTRGNGCPYVDGNRVSGPCNIFGNADLEPETSINKEIGIAYNQNGWEGGLTYFDNDYKNKIIADMGDQNIPPVVNGYRAFKWFNAGKAIVRGFEGYFNVPILGNEGSVLKLINNITWMNKNESKTTGQPLSVIPKYTLNSTFDWRPHERFSLQLYGTFYGKQKPRTMNMANNTEATGDQLNERGAYAIFGLSAGYDLSENFNLRAGVNNLADKRLYREDPGTGQGAATYNEPGRSFYLLLTASF
ncbi:MAG: FepA family TonB-dependent siderophore receptor [Burkholderiales bacterium]|nr:FepA family TonB-dependent siderophore receptor [Burkholderiales bacterium]